MKVAIVAMTGFYPKDIGGPGSIAYFLAKELGKKNIFSYIFIKASNEEFARLMRTSEIKDLSNVKFVTISIDYNYPSFLNLPSLISCIIKTNKDLISIIRDIDLIIFNSPPVDITCCFPILGRIYGKKKLFILHGNLFWVKKYFIRRMIMRFQRCFLDRIVVISSFSNDLALKFGFSRERIIKIPNGVYVIPSVQMIDLSGNPKILYVGVLESWKNVSTLIRAFTLFNRLFRESILYIVGEGTERQELENLTEQLGVRSNIRFEGYISHSKGQLSKYYEACDILVLPSLKENFAMVLLEGMAAGIPIIASDIEGGNKELIHDGVNGFLVNPYDCESLAKKMTYLINDKSLAKEFIKLSKQKISEYYTWDKIILKYLKLFNEMGNEP